MDMSVVTWIWTVFIAAILFIKLSHVEAVKNALPTIIKDALVYGKLMDKRKRSFLERYLLVPKWWFLHFYILSFLWNGMTFLFVLRFATQGTAVPPWFVSLLGTVTNYPITTPSVDLVTMLIVLVVMVMHAARRVYECVAVSVYSSSNMHLAHYLLGVSFYSLLGVSILAEGPQLTQAEEIYNFWQLLSGVRGRHIVGLVMMGWATWHHHKAHQIFAGLRMGKRDVNQHLIPRGDWFEYVSCPHYLAECLIYIALGIMLGPAHITWWFALGFVVSNQLTAAIMVHVWYREKFKDYPKDRKAIIPFLI